MLRESEDNMKSEQSALMEMVDNLTESKVALTTKVRNTAMWMTLILS